jgi:MATE family multidrug resistance protein
VANLVHVELDFILIFGAGPIPAMGIAGAALATTLSMWVQFWLLSRELGPSPQGVQRRPDAQAMRFAAKVGAPIGLHFLVESGIFSLAGVLAARLSGPAVAAHQIALNWASLTFCVAAGIGSAATVRVGWGVGGRDTQAARRSGLLAFWSGGLFMAASSLMFLVVPEPLARLMSDKPEVIATVVSLFTVTAFFQIFDGVQVVGAGSLRGAGDTRFPFLANFLGHWFIGLPVAWFLGVKGTLGVVGLWWGLCVGLMAVSVAVLLRFLKLTSKEVRALETQGPGAPPTIAGA